MVFSSYQTPCKTVVNILKRKTPFLWTSRSSAASTEHTPAYDLPSLPTELLLVIFCETATNPTSSLLDPLSFLHPANYSYSDYESSMRQKLVLALVNKAWNRIMQDLLYEFIWIRKASQAKALARTLLTQEFVDGKETSGKFIKRLHMETDVYQRCAPVDIRTILDYAPNLFIYSDHGSIRRARSEAYPDPRCSSGDILKSVLSRPGAKLRRLVWTSYTDNPLPRNIPASLSLCQTASDLEYLELTCSSLTHSSLSLDVVSDMTQCPPKPVFLPSLKALKVVLDNLIFAKLATWSLPSLENLSVISADYAYAGKGFAMFFRAHGARIRQLELGHSTTTIEQHLLQTTPGTARPIPLAEYCPNLVEFICSANAEWNWRSPDWIAPHILLPTHPTLQLIGIRSIHQRMSDDIWAFGSARDHPDDISPFFPLLEQMSSLLHVEAFPCLRFIRDMSPESHELRKHCPEERVLRFWETVLKQCRQRGDVWLEDFQGVNITLRDIRRARMDKMIFG